MPFRWRGGTKGFIARSASRAVRRASYRKGGGAGSTSTSTSTSTSILVPILILLTLIFLCQSPIVLAIVIIVGIVFLEVKKHYIQSAISWFFLKENESNGTVLPYKEMVNRTFKAISETSKVEKAILAVLAIIALVICEILAIALIFRSTS